MTPFWRQALFPTLLLSQPRSVWTSGKTPGFLKSSTNKSLLLKESSHLKSSRLKLKKLSGRTTACLLIPCRLKTLPSLPLALAGRSSSTRSCKGLSGSEERKVKTSLRFPSVNRNGLENSLRQSSLGNPFLLKESSKKSTLLSTRCFSAPSSKRVKTTLLRWEENKLNTTLTLSCSL